MLWRSRPTENEPIVHSGVLFKRGSGRLLGRKNWKTRHFVLTRTKLQYFTFENGKFRDEVDLSPCSPDCLEIMPLSARKTGRSASTIWRFEIRTPNGRRLLMAAPTEREMNVWIHRLTIVLKNLRPQAEASSPVADLEVCATQSEKASHSPISCAHSVSPRGHDERDEDRVFAPNWKSSTDFQNFVAQPRRSVIFGRQAGDVRKVLHRHSIGEFGPADLATETTEKPVSAEATSPHESTSDDDGLDSEDQATALQRRFSTGSRLLTSELSALAAERDEATTQREDALMKDLLASLVADDLENRRRATSAAVVPNVIEKSSGKSSEVEIEDARDSHDNTPTASASSSPMLSPLGDEKEVERESFEKNVDHLVGSQKDMDVVLTSPSSQTARGTQSRIQVETESYEERPSLLRRLSLKLGRRRSSVAA